MIIDDLYITSTFLSSTIIMVLGIQLFFIYIFRSEQTNKLRIARNTLALTYLLLAIPGFLECFVDPFHDMRTIVIFTLSTVALETLLFSGTLLILIQPRYITLQRIIRHSAIVITGVTIFVSLALKYNTNPWILNVGLAVFICQLISYTWLFRRRYAESLRKLEAYFDEDEYSRLRWVKFGFYATLGIGVLALIFAYLPESAYLAFTIIYTVFYIWFASRFSNYMIHAKYYLAAITKISESTLPEKEIIADSSLQKREQQLRQTLDSWVSDKKYLKKDIGIEDIAAELKTDIAFLRYYYRTYMTSDFRTWRNDLRIKEAQTLLTSQPALSVNRISQIVGFTTRSNFYAYFQKATGETPADYRKRLTGHT